MQNYKWIPLVCTLLAFALAACQGNASVPASPSTNEGDLETKGFVESADGKLRVIGKGQLLVSLKSIANPPAAPAGWELVGPVFDVTAQDRQKRPVQKLAALLKLRFAVPADRPTTVLVHNSQAWEIVPSEIDADGNLTAEVDHLTPYAAAAPAQTRNVPQITPSAKATVTKETTSASDAKAALESAVVSVKGKKVAVTSAAGYTGSLYVALPGSLQDAVNAVTASGTAYYGLYNAVNPVFNAQAKSGSGTQGTLTLLVEPKTAMPANATDARSSLAALFAGVPVSTLTQARAETTAYVFYGTSGNTAYNAGYVSYSGVVLAYAMVGSGAYQALVPKQ